MRYLLAGALGLLALAGPAAAADSGTWDGLDTEYVRIIRVYADFADVDVQATDGEFRGAWNRLDDGDPTLEPAAVVNGRQLLVRAQGIDGRYRMTLHVPREWEQFVQVYRRGRIQIDGAGGAVTAWSAGGDVYLGAQNGSFSVTAMDGNARVEFVGAALVAPSAVSAHVPTLGTRGVTLSIPSGLATTIRAAASGDLRSDFVDFARNDGGFAVAEVNGGGPTITLRNLNGDVEVKQSGAVQ
jgi:hypothetical protein